MSSQKLPSELLFKIFGNIHDVKHLANARLVCRSWGTVAEIVMLGKHITIYSESTAQKLIHHLEANPDNGRLIRTLNYPVNSLGHPCEPSKKDMLKLLHLSFTPKMVKFEGMGGAQFFKEMIKIKCRSDDEFHHLKVIPWPNWGENFTTYYLAAIEFKNTLEVLHIYYEGLRKDHRYQLIASKLDEFTCLTTLHIQGAHMEITVINNILSKCPHLQKLKMNIIFDPGNFEVDDAVCIDQFIENNNMKELIFTTLTIGPTATDILHFLILKFPSLEKLSVYTRLEHFTGDVNHSLFQICDAVKDIPSYAMEIGLPAQRDQFEFILTQLQSENHTVTITNHDHDTFISLEIMKGMTD